MQYSIGGVIDILNDKMFSKPPPPPGTPQILIKKYLEQLMKSFSILKNNALKVKTQKYLDGAYNFYCV